MSTNKIGFNNFKAFGGKMQTFSKKPITLIYGPNSIGKSSFLHSQLYFEYIKESGKLDLHSTKFAGDEFDLNGFDNFVHKKDTKNSINFETVVKNKGDIYSLLNMFTRGLTQNEIQLLVSNIKTTDDAIKWLNKIDADTYRHYSILYNIDKVKNHKTMGEKYQSILKHPSVKNSDEVYKVFSDVKSTMESTIELLQDGLIFSFKGHKALDIFKKYGIEAFKDKDKVKGELQKILKEKDSVIKNRRLEVYTEKWLEENKGKPEIDDVEISIFKLLYYSVHSLENENKENIALNLMLEVDFLNYISNIDTLIINFEINKSTTQEPILNIAYSIDSELLFQADQEGGKHKITINKNNKFLLELDKKYKSFIDIGNKNLVSVDALGLSGEDIKAYEKRRGTTYSLLEETKNFPLSLLWTKDEKDLLLKMNDMSSSMYKFFDSRSWRSTYHLKNVKEILFYPLLWNTILFIIVNDNTKKSQYFGPLRFYPSRFEHLIEKEIDKNDQLDGENIWEYIKQSDVLQESLNKLLSNEDLFNTSYAVTIAKKLNLYDLEINSLDLKGKTSSEIVEILKGISKVDNELVFIDTKNDTPVGLRDMGLGNAQMIPFLLLCDYEANTRFFIEQPELHLHPKVQAELADEFIRSYKEGDNEFLIETHSEHLLLRIMRRMRYTAEEKVDRDKSLDLTPDDVCLLYIDNDGESTYVQELRLSPKGKLLDHWPNGFFEEGFKERFS